MDTERMVTWDEAMAFASAVALASGWNESDDNEEEN